MSAVYFCCKQNRREAVLDPNAKANLNGIDFLEVLDHDAPLFSAADFVKLSNLIAKLTAAAPDNISAFLTSQFSNEAKATLANPASTAQEQAAALVVALNSVIQRGSSIYASARFSGVALSQKTSDLLAQNPQGVELTRLNRLLLEDACPSEIAKSPDRQRTLVVHFLKPLLPPTDAKALKTGNVRIDGGERILAGSLLRGFIVSAVTIGTDTEAQILTVKVTRPGDFSIYTLSIVADVTDPKSSAPPAGFDPMLSAVDFSFKVECPSDFDCKTERACPAEPRPTPDIDYLAKDYASFRQLMLDRLTALMPQWQERNVTDLGITLVELLAYVGDHLSYQQDAVATEAYLGTAQRRVSVRRHARLVDYFMHDGCNARVWVQVTVDSGAPVLPKGTQLLTASGAEAGRIAPNSAALDAALRSSPEVFETMHDAPLFAEHHQMNFYTWSDDQCCLPKGATKATLAGIYPNLKTHDVLIFEEVFGPLTGTSEDANPARRQAVRLSQIPILKVDPLNGSSITEIEWFAEDALKFPFCISAVTDKGHGGQALPGVSVARGNIVLADHGATISEQSIGIVPDRTPGRVMPVSGDRCHPTDPVKVPPRFRPRLQNPQLTMAATVQITEIIAGESKTSVVSFDPNAPASAAFDWKIQDVLPVISLNGGVWSPHYDLLASDPSDAHFVAEVGEDGFGTLRFGDGKHGLCPQPEEAFSATYRIGNGVRGNVGAETIVSIVTADSAITGVRNPLPASGGVDPETIEHVRQSAPSAFRIQERAVTPADYEAVAKRYPGIQQAAASFRWTGSWRTVFIAVDRLGGLEVDDDFKGKILAHIERYRMAGQNLEIDKPLYVSLKIEMTVCAKADYFRGDVKAALLEVFSNRILADGTRGVFHLDNFSFGQTVYLSPLYAAAMKVEGVAAVKVTTFERQAARDLNQSALKAGKLTLARLEIARLDNDPNFPEHGVLVLNVEDGK